jgi:Helicase HerA, central domain
VRVGILVGGLLLASVIVYLATGHLIPQSSNGALVYQNGLLLLVLGSTIIEHKFTKPADSLVNSLMGLLTLVPVYTDAPRLAWVAVFGFVVLVFLSAVLCVASSDSPVATGLRSRVSDATYGFATFFGQARILFSIILLFGVLSFYTLQSTKTVILLSFWGMYLAIWPLGLPELISSLSFRKGGKMAIAGSILRFESPNIVRVKVASGVGWSPLHPKLCSLSNGPSGVVLPLYLDQQPDHVVGTGIFVESADTNASHAMRSGMLYEYPSKPGITGTDAARMLGATADTPLIGYIVEDSEIAQIRFQTWDQAACKEGDLVWVKLGAESIYYQIVNGVNREETFESNRYGFQIAVAAQVGIADSKGFQKYPWLPAMNTPVFGINKGFGSEMFKAGPSDMLLGVIPGTKIPIHFSLDKALDHHTAILGVTGTGKTELAFDIIRQAAQTGTKVICIDLTGRYEDRLKDLKPQQLSISDSLARELNTKLFAVEVGKDYAREEKKVLHNFRAKLKTDVGSILKKFFEDKSVDARVGVITLPDISNTKATLFITELYLSLILLYAKMYPETGRVLLVLEEAHTVIPEATTMGLADFDSKGLVGKMAQIALQGRKYHVGLLVLAQRTATVSKTVLTQCNTVVSFSCIDETSLGFLSNVFGSSHASIIPNLRPLQAVAFGKAIRSERPIVVEIPFSAEKVDADDRAARQREPRKPLEQSAKVEEVAAFEARVPTATSAPTREQHEDEAAEVED